MSIFGTKVEVVYVIFGLVIAVAGGTLIEKMHLENYVEAFVRNASAVDIDSPTLTQKERLEYAKDQVVSTFRKVFPYIVVGVGIGALIHNWIPEVWVESILGSNNPFGVILATLIGIPMYADIFGTIPIAEALLAKGAQLGTILSFMMAVTTLSLPSLIMLRKAVKPKLLGIFIAILGYTAKDFQRYVLKKSEKLLDKSFRSGIVEYTFDTNGITIISNIGESINYWNAFKEYGTFGDISMLKGKTTK